jgi:hypothetical protein
MRTGRKCYPMFLVVFAAGLILSGAASARAQPPGPQTSAKAAESGPSASGFRLLVAHDLLCIPLGFSANRADGLFRVQRNGKGTEHGFFDVDGKPVAPVWSSSNPSVLQLRDSGWPFRVRGLGKATITVSVGD